MDLKKSLEKAKLQDEARQKTGEVDTFEKAIGKDIAEPSALNADPAGKEWTPPVYSQSTPALLDMEHLRRNRVVSIFPEGPESEQYKVLRTNIQRYARLNNWNTIMVTSVQPGEGKTLTSINLSISFAKEFNQTVLLVDCDLRRQSVHKYLGLSSDKGIVNYLLDSRQLKDIIIWPNIEKLTLISGGKTINNSSELVGSPRMKELVTEIKNRYNDRFIIFDTPPVLSGADTIAFAPFVDCIIMVVEEGRTSSQEVNRALEMIPGEKFMGFVLNRSQNRTRHYYY